MLALTLHRPWPDAILYGGKRCENRGWLPWRRVLGQTIALHAGCAYGIGSWCVPDVGWLPPSRALSAQGLVGTCRIVGALRWSSDEPRTDCPSCRGQREVYVLREDTVRLCRVCRGTGAAPQPWVDRAVVSMPGASAEQLARLITLNSDPWWTGPVGWLLDEVRALREPLPCRGAQGLWVVPEVAEEAIREQLAA